MDYVSHIQTFMAVVRCGSFSEAARELGVVPSMVAKRVSSLEQHLKTRLFERTTRKVNLTEAGEKFHSRAIGVVSELEDLLDTVERDDGKLEGHIRLMAPTTLGIQRLGPLLNEFLSQHPRITLEMALVDRSTNPAEEGFDLAISGRLASYEGVVDMPLRPVQPTLCATPEYLAEHPEIEHPRDLSNHSCLVFSATGSDWHFQSPRGVISVEVQARLLADDNMTLLDGALRSLGVAILPSYVVEEYLQQGTLVAVLPKYPPQENWFKAYVPRRRMQVARVQALIEWLKNREL
jgi:DNA-binding transcriptional LysR family regulator